MDHWQGTSTSIRERRSVKKFTGDPLDTETIQELLELAVMAPNHRMTEPWSFIVMGPETRRAYGAIKGESRARRLDDPKVGTRVRDQTIASMEGLPTMIAFLQRLDDDPTVREEDFATVYMGMQNVLIGATARGLGTHVKTGAILDEEPVRRLLQVEEDHRVVALVHLGVPDELPPARPRKPATHCTRWLP
jgi:nitroreductase